MMGDLIDGPNGQQQPVSAPVADAQAHDAQDPCAGAAVPAQAPPEQSAAQPEPEQPVPSPAEHACAAAPTTDAEPPTPADANANATPTSDWTERFDAVERHLTETDARFEAIGKRLDDVTESIGNLSGEFSKRMQYDDTKEKVIDRQHSELNKLRDGLTFDLREPVLQDIASALAKINMMKDEIADGNDDAKDMLEDIDFMLGAILDDYGVERVDSEPGTPFNAAGQRYLAKDVETTDDPSKSRTIARSKAPGYVYNTGEHPRVLLKEQVVMYKVVKAETATAAAPTTDEPQCDQPAVSDTPSSIG